jgi:hypothetical protein
LFTPDSVLRAIRSSMTLVFNEAMDMSVMPISIISTTTKATPF